MIKETPSAQHSLPKHIAIIMDGNGRWAKRRGLPRIFGHREGARNVKRIATACSDLGIKILTIYGFSVENWNRPARTVWPGVPLAEGTNGRTGADGAGGGA